MRIEFTHSFGLAVISFWLLGVRIFLSADGPLKIYRCLFPPSPETLERRRKIHQLQTQIRELQVQCERLHSPDTFVEYAKTKRRINQLQKTLDRTPAPQDSEPSQFVSKFLHFGVQVRPSSMDASIIIYLLASRFDKNSPLVRLSPNLAGTPCIVHRLRVLGQGQTPLHSWVLGTVGTYAPSHPSASTYFVLGLTLLEFIFSDLQ